MEWNFMKKKAVALQYEPEKDNAPKVIASGAGYLAEKIIEKAIEEKIPVHEDDKLAESLSQIEIGEAIPPELYKIVADVLVYVDNMDKIKGKVMPHNGKWWIINKRSLGSQKEQEAIDYLKENGYLIRERNFWSHYGEIDIVADDGGYLVFIEVKFRSSLKYGYPQESVSSYKQRTIIQTALFYMYKQGISPEYPVRFDVVIMIEGNIQVIKNAFHVS